MKQINIKINGELRYGPFNYENDSEIAWVQKLKDKKILVDAVAEDGTVTPVNYDLKVTDVTAEVEAEKTKALKKANAKAAVKALDPATVDKITTVKDLKTIVLKLLEAMND